MKHQLSEANKLHNRQNHQSELEYQIMVGKQFNQNQHQLQLKKKKVTELMKVVTTKN
jgi:hypothetical protein